jgi:hypothetical protein
MSEPNTNFADSNMPDFQNHEKQKQNNRRTVNRNYVTRKPYSFQIMACVPEVEVGEGYAHHHMIEARDSHGRHSTEVETAQRILTCEADFYYTNS